MYHYLGAPPDPTDAQLTAMLREALGPAGPLDRDRSSQAGTSPGMPDSGAGLGLVGWLLLLGIGGAGLLLLSRRR